MLQPVVFDVARLNQAKRRDMYTLFAQYYLDTSYRLFEHDLSGKDTAILLYDDDGRMGGFSTLQRYDFQHEGRAFRIIFSGDTIIDRAHWGSQTFAFAWIRYAGQVAAAAPDIPLFWLLIVKGHRTYRYLPAFACHFVPDWRKANDAQLVSLRNALANARFGAAYDAERGVLRFANPQGRLAPEWAAISDRERARPDVRFFLDRNPGYTQGDELVCLCELSASNLRPIARRVFEQGYGA